MAWAAALLLLLCASGPVAAARSPSALRSFAGSRRSLLLDQSSCCNLVEATATGGTLACSSSGLVLTVPSAEFAAFSAAISVTGKAGNTAVMNTADLAGQTCSFRAATWGSSADGATTLAVAAGTDPACSTGTEGSCQGLVQEAGSVTALSIAGRHSCAIRRNDGAVLCSGNNAFGQLGTGTTTASSSLKAALAPGAGTAILTGATAISVGGRAEAVAPSGTTCACLKSGQAVCFGQNTYGQLAAAIPVTTAAVTRPTYVMTDADGTLPLANCKAVSAGVNHTLFLTSTGDIYAAGRNGYSELGLGTTTVTNYAAQVPRASVGDKAATGICAGKRHSCAVFEDNTVACVGAQGHGQTGLGYRGSTPSATWGFVAGISDAVQVHCGELSTCVLRKGGKVSCFGWGPAVGYGGDADAVPTPFETLAGGALGVATGEIHTCALMRDASVKCWGIGWDGQLATGEATPPRDPWLTPQASTFTGAMSIHAGGNSTCIINGLGERLCAGNNKFGQLALATTSTINNSPAPTIIPAGLGPTSFSAPAPFVSVSDAASNPVCTLLLSVKVDATCDPTPPAFNPPLEDITADATSAGGAIVTYSPTAEDEGAPVDVTCTPPSGSQFATGSTTVTCQAGVTTGAFMVTVAVAPPAFAASAPTASFEASTNTPYLGTSVEGKYKPTASDPVDGDLSASVETYLVSTNEQIFLAGPNAYIFPVGSTQIQNTVTNSFGVGADEFVTIVVVAPKPTLTVDTAPVVVVTQPAKVPLKTVKYDSKCTATDALEPVVSITYDPPSGRTVGTAPFFVGSTSTVTCTATTASGSTATGTFAVIVRRPPGQDQ